MVMFLCDGCHEDRGCTHFGRRLSRCEICGERAGGVDCKGDFHVYDPRSVEEAAQTFLLPDGDAADNLARGAAVVASMGYQTDRGAR
jgi:hypothetical protein